MFPGEIDVQPSTYLDHLGTIFARFAADTQDSGNIAYGVQTAPRQRCAVRRTPGSHHHPVSELRGLPPGVVLGD